MEVTQQNEIITIESLSNSEISYIHIIQKVTTESSTIVYSNITSSMSSFNLITDGYYVITEISLPNIIDNTPNHYYILNNEIYTWNGVKCEINDFININLDTTNIIKENIDYFSKYYLYTYYINTVKNKFLKNIYPCNNSLFITTDKIVVDTI